MAEPRVVNTIELSGNDYAKVAERLKQFREDNPHGKTESAYEYDVDKTVTFTVWVWKNKKELLELMKAGVTDQATLRSSADANGTAKSAVGAKQKDFEKLETIALGRALAQLGYLASGEIASSEEMEEFEKFQQDKRQQLIDAAVEQIKATKNNDELTALTKEIMEALKYAPVIEAGRAQRKKFETGATPPKPKAAPDKPQAKETSNANS